MKRCVLLAPGPSMTEEIARSATADIVGVVNNVFRLRDRATFLAANDRAWWAEYPEALRYEAARYSCNRIAGVGQIGGGSSQWNSGVLALEVAACLGATYIELYGFDMHGSHFFGPYENGLGNTRPDRREVHQKQYGTWKIKHPGITVVNRTPGSQLRAYPCYE